jgi:hypothetical protein
VAAAAGAGKVELLTHLPTRRAAAVLEVLAPLMLAAAQAVQQARNAREPGAVCTTLSAIQFCAR